MKDRRMKELSIDQCWQQGQPAENDKPAPLFSPIGTIMARALALCFFIEPLPRAASTLVATVLASASAEMSDLQPGASQQSPAAKTLLFGKNLDTSCSFVVDDDQPAGSDRRQIDVGDELRIGRVSHGKEDIVGRKLFALFRLDHCSRDLLLQHDIGSGDVFVSED